MTRTTVHVYADQNPVVRDITPSGHISVEVATNHTVGSNDPGTMHALADAFRNAASQLERFALKADLAAARAVNANRSTEPFGTVPARVTSSTAPEPFDTTDAA